ncbi:MFS transporter [Desulfotignum phosphitoxidans]|uniref:MFS-type transporter n=1 Tax=Desulfotignum phosphitoxidans DSM 13687 TaxID=1286635 RepID=S0G2D9_9BACT|nr:MFS transporter [Desulfotignum phosphitoxidans]EMS78317.1 MFS-type transporter [Desulfotignum phosphitoxidans DSM 13687]
MYANIRPFIALYSSVVLMMMGLGLLNTFLGFRLSLEGVSTQVTGLVLSSYFVGLVAGTSYCRKIIQNVGHIRAFAAFTAVTAAVVMVHGFYTSPLLWAGLRFVAGVSNMGLFMVIESWLNECAEPKFRGRIFSIYMIVTYMGSTVGQQLLNVGDVRSQTLFLVAGVFVVLSTVPVAMTRSIHPKLPKVQQKALKTILRKAPISMLGCFGSGLLHSAFYTMGPVFAHQIQLSVGQISWFMTLTVFGGLMLQWPVGLISDRLDRSLVLPFLGIILAMISLVILISFQHSLGFLLGTTTLFGGIFFSIYPVAVARAHDIFDAQDVVKVSSVLLLFYGIGAVFGPILSAAVMTLSGTPYGLYFYMIAVSGVYAGVTLLLRRRESVRIVPVDEQVDFVMMETTSDVAMHLDPRMEISSEHAQSTVASNGPVQDHDRAGA